MAAHARILNLTTQSEVKPGQARRWVASGVFAWVETGVSIRKLTMAEMVQERSRLSGGTEPFPWAEERGVKVVDLQGIAAQRMLARVTTHYAVSLMAPRTAGASVSR